MNDELLNAIEERALIAKNDGYFTAPPEETLGEILALANAVRILSNMLYEMTNLTDWRLAGYNIEEYDAFNERGEIPSSSITKGRQS